MPGSMLVTGAAGFLGRHLIRELLAENGRVVALCRRPDELADLAHPALAIAAGDVCDAQLCAGLLAGVDSVFHLAAIRNRPGSSPDDMRAVNEVATVRLARQSIDAGVRRFVHVATALVFGPSSSPVDEGAPLVVDDASVGTYAAGKARAVAELRKLALAGAPVAIVYPTLVYGPDHPSHPNRITSQIRRLLRRRFDVVIGGGRARRDLVHVDDVVASLLAVAASSQASCGEVLVAGEPISQRGLAELVAHSAERSAPLVVSLPVRFASIAARILDRTAGYEPGSGTAWAVDTLAREWTFRSGRMRELLNRPPRPLAQGVAETVAWIRRGAR